MSLDMDGATREAEAHRNETGHQAVIESNVFAEGMLYSVQCEECGWEQWAPDTAAAGQLAGGHHPVGIEAPEDRFRNYYAKCDHCSWQTGAVSITYEDADAEAEAHRAETGHQAVLVSQWTSEDPSTANSYRLLCGSCGWKTYVSDLDVARTEAAAHHVVHTYGP